MYENCRGYWRNSWNRYRSSEKSLSKGWAVHATGVCNTEVHEFQVAHPDVYSTVLDVRDNPAIMDYFAEFEKIDGLVNCAGILARYGEYDLETFENVININLTGTMRTCLAAKTLLAKTKGAIVNTASMLSYFGGPLVLLTQHQKVVFRS